MVFSVATVHFTRDGLREWFYRCQNLEGQLNGWKLEDELSRIFDPWGANNECTAETNHNGQELSISHEATNADRRTKENGPA